MRDEDYGKNSERDYLERVKEAARDGAREGAKSGTGAGGKAKGSLGFGGIILILLLTSVIIAGVVTIRRFEGSFEEFREEFSSFEAPAEAHELVLDDDGFLGYTAADFAEAVLGEQSKLCKIEVLRQDVSDATTIIDTGLAKWSTFTKTQLITYHGVAIYTVDLSGLSENDFELDEDEKTVTIHIPHAVLEPINIQSEDIEFGEVSKGVFAFGDIKMTPEQMAEVQTAAQDKMEAKVIELKIIENADKFAKMVVWDMYQPVINSVEKGYSLEVVFK